MTWWHGTSVYQIYPRSFADSNGDGIGDIQGILNRLDYLADLGVETLWVSPFFASPQEDFGYDITDYVSVAPEYGTVSDAQRLIDETHSRGMKILFDLVLNHTSDQHPWFIRSKASRTNPKDDWYIWADGRGRGGRRPPNNWRSAMEVKTAWQWSPERKQWYLATFLPFQPDLNWRNPDVKAAMFDAVRFWLARGVDGCRLDIFGQIMKDPQLRNNPVHFNTGTGFPRLWRRQFTENTADNIALAKELRAVADEFADSDRILIGEVFGPAQVLQAYLGDSTGDGGNGLNLVFLFDFLTYKYEARWFADIIASFEESFPAPLQPTYVLENHDRIRSISRVHGDTAKAKVLAVILLTLRGVPTIYNGQEIGMANTPIPMRDALDPIVATFFRWLPDAIAQRLPETLNRDEMRTPMQWDDSPNAGFTRPGVRPWLPISPTYKKVNVAVESEDPQSMLELYRRLFAIRREYEVLRTGSLTLLPNLPPGVLGYRRELDGDTITVLANLGTELQSIPGLSGTALASCGDASLKDGSLSLPPDSACVVAI
ncbi:MAG: alpha-amylase family glycosyl hydrolase [Actinomycetes bacterium]